MGACIIDGCGRRSGSGSHREGGRGASGVVEVRVGSISRWSARKILGRRRVMTVVVLWMFFVFLYSVFMFFDRVCFDCNNGGSIFTICGMSVRVPS